MALIRTVAVRLTDPSGPPEARRTASAMARQAGLDEQDVGRLALVVTELCTNVTKHARRGVVSLSVWAEGGTRVVQVVTVDGGPGFDVEACLRDGHSTTGTPGGGLGAVRRLSDAFDVYSAPGIGSVLVSEVRERHGENQRPSFRLGGVSVPKEGERECGDSWSASWGDGGVARVFLADGIGHGEQAAAASQAAVDAFEQAGARQPADVLERVHAALRPTRGATVALASIDVTAGEVRFVGVGNISASIVGVNPVRHLVSHNGTAGHEVRKIQEFRYAWPQTGLLVMASDGLGTRWDLDRYPGLLSHHPALVAGVLYRDFGRSRDDVTVVAGRQEPRRGAASLP